MSTTKSPPIKEQLPLLQGQGGYVDDINLPGTRHVAFVRTPYAHARLVKVETAEAARQPGVLAVFSGEELRSHIKPLRPPLRHPTYQATDWYPLTWDKVRYVGQAVAVVVAVNRYLAEDAAECVMVEYEPLPVVATVAESMAGDALRIHDELASNILIHHQIGTGEAEDAFEQAEIRLRSTFQHPRVSCLPMENCGVLADYRAETDELLVWSSTQVPHLLRDALSDCLNQPAHQLRVIAPNVGGGFGLKSQILPEELLIPYLARQLKQPVKWIQDRNINSVLVIY